MGTWIKVERNREQSTIDLHMGIPFETVTLTSFGRNKQLYFNILEEGKIECIFIFSTFNSVKWVELIMFIIKK